MTQTSLSRSKGQSHQAALLTAALTREAGAAVTVITYGCGKLLLRCVCSAAREALGRPRGVGGGGAGHIVSPRAQLVFITLGKSLAFVKKILCKKSKMFRKRAIEQCTLLFWLRKSV